MTDPAFAQVTYTWTGSAGTNDANTATNWAPAGGPPGSTTTLTNADRATFGSAGATVDWLIADGTTRALGAVATTTTSSGAGVFVNLLGNGGFRLNGGYTVGSFTNIVLAAGNRNLSLVSTSPAVQLGTGTASGQLYAAPGRVLAVTAGTMSNGAAAPLAVVGGGHVRLIGDLNLNNRDLQVNAGVLSLKGNVNQGSGVIRVANGASLQAGNLSGDAQGIAGTVVFADGGGIRTLVNASGTSPSVIQNGTYTKGATDHFRILLSGIDPGQPGTFNSNGVVMTGTFNGFANGTFTQSTPGSFLVEGDGFTVTSWSVTMNGNQLTLNSFSVTPVPEPTGLLAVPLLAAGGWAVRRRQRRRG